MLLDEFETVSASSHQPLALYKDTEISTTSNQSSQYVEFNQKYNTIFCEKSIIFSKMSILF